MRPIENATGDTGSTPKKQRKVMTLQDKIDLLGMFRGLRFAAVVPCHFKMNPALRPLFKKRKEKKNVPAGAKTLQISSLLLKIQLLCGCKIAIRKAYLWNLICIKKK